MHKGIRLIQDTSRGAGSIGRHGVKDRVVDVEPVARGYVAGGLPSGRGAKPRLQSNGWPYSFSTERLTWIYRRCPNGLQQQTVAPGSLVWRQPLVPAGSSNLDIHRIATLSVPALPSPDEWCSQGPRAALTWMCAFYGTVTQPGRARSISHGNSSALVDGGA